MNRRDFLKMLLATPFIFYSNKAEANNMKLIANNSPDISYFGRWLNGYTGFGATYIKAKFTGTKIGAILKSPGIWWRVHIDDNEPIKFTANGEVLLAQNLKDGEHEIKLVRSTEGQAGIAYFGGFIVEKNANLTKAQRSAHTLEFIGDSITAGAMNDGVLTKTNYNEIGDNDASYGPVLARMIGAEYSVVAKSGQGVAINYGERPPFTMPHAADLYNWTFFSNSFEENHIDWEPKNFPVDAVFVAYGTNDFVTPYEKPDEHLFKRKYKRIIRNIREKNGNVPIICLLIPSQKHVPLAAKYISETVQQLQVLGDNNVNYIEINKNKPLLSPKDFIGDNIHPTKEGSKKVAEFLLPKVKKLLNW